MERFELIIGLLLVGALLASIARRLKVPYPVLLAGLGVALAFAPNLPDLTLDPQLALALFVAPVLLDAAYDASLRDLKDNWLPVANLALVAVGVTVVSVAVVVRLFLPDMPWPAAVALGAIVAPPDASAATAVLRMLRPPHRVLVVLEGESLFNDASALLIYRAAVGLVTTGTTLMNQIPFLLFAGIASVFAGIFLARLYLLIAHRFQEVATAVLMQFVSVFIVWILAEQSHLSGIITMVCYAITLAHGGATRLEARLRIPSYAVWEVIVFVLNILVFIFVGLQLKPLLQRLDPEEWDRYLLIGGTVCATTILVRIAWVMSYNAVVRWKNRHFGFRLPSRVSPPTVQGAIMISWCGMRGIVTLATALALPDAFPYRDLLLFAAFCVVVGTLIIQGLTLRPLMTALRFAADRVVEDEVQRARIEITRAALNSLNLQQGSAAIAVLRREYEARLISGTDVNQAGESTTPELAIIQSRTIAEERRALTLMRTRGDIGDDAFHRIEEELDWAEVYAERALRAVQISPTD